MSEPIVPMVDLTEARRSAQHWAHEWGVTLLEPFALSNVSFVAPTEDGLVVKSAWDGDDEALHEGDALALWDGDGAVRLLRRAGRVLLEERATPGDDLSAVSEDEAVAVAVDLATRLWRPATSPFRPVDPEIERWLDEAEVAGHELVPLARELFAEVRGTPQWVVHGDFHHHNILRAGERFVAIDPKPYLSDREYDVASFLWNPIGRDVRDLETTERRVAAFVEVGLDDFRVRAWAVIRGSYLRPGPDHVEALRALVSRA